MPPPVRPPAARAARTIKLPPPAPPPLPTGIDPAFVNQTLVDAGQTTRLITGSDPSKPQIAGTSGNSAWMISFSDCGQDQRCGQMEFYTLWRVSNEFNVCSAWKLAVTNDPFGSAGKPTCYTLPTAGKQLHLTMSTTQPPYTGLSMLNGDRAKARILSMLGVWTEFVGKLPEAYEYARRHCPRKNTKCEAEVTVQEASTQRQRLPTDRALPGY